MKRREFLLTTGGVVAAAIAANGTSRTAPWLFKKFSRWSGPANATKVWFTHSTRPDRGRLAGNRLINTPGFVGCADLRTGQCELLDVPLFGHEVIQNPLNPQILFTAEKWGLYAAIIDFKSRKIIAKIENGKGRRFFGHAQFAIDGQSVFSSEMNDLSGEGVVVQRDLKTGLILNEFGSGGVLPHQLRWIRGGKSIAVINYAEGFLKPHEIDSNPKSPFQPVPLSKRAPSSDESTLGNRLAGGSKLTVLTLDSRGIFSETESRLTALPSLFHFDWDPTTDLFFAAGNFEPGLVKATRTRSALEILASPEFAPSGQVLSSPQNPATPAKIFDFARAGSNGFLGEALSVAACPARSQIAVSLPESKSLLLWDWATDRLIHVERFGEVARGVVFVDPETLIVTVGPELRVFKYGRDRWSETLRFPAGNGSHLTLGV